MDTCAGGGEDLQAADQRTPQPDRVLAVQTGRHTGRRGITTGCEMYISFLVPISIIYTVPTKSLETTCHFSYFLPLQHHVLSNLIIPMHV